MSVQMLIFLHKVVWLDETTNRYYFVMVPTDSERRTTSIRAMGEIKIMAKY